MVQQLEKNLNSAFLTIASRTRMEIIPDQVLSRSQNVLNAPLKATRLSLSLAPYKIIFYFNTRNLLSLFLLLLGNAAWYHCLHLIFCYSSRRLSNDDAIHREYIRVRVPAHATAMTALKYNIRFNNEKCQAFRKHYKKILFLAFGWFTKRTGSGMYDRRGECKWIKQR